MSFKIIQTSGGTPQLPKKVLTIVPSTWEPSGSMKYSQSCAQQSVSFIKMAKNESSVPLGRPLLSPYVGLFDTLVSIGYICVLIRE